MSEQTKFDSANKKDCRRLWNEMLKRAKESPGKPGNDFTQNALPRCLKFKFNSLRFG